MWTLSDYLGMVGVTTEITCEGESIAPTYERLAGLKWTMEGEPGVPCGGQDT